MLLNDIRSNNAHRTLSSLAIVPQIRVKENNSSFLLFLTLTLLFRYHCFFIYLYYISGSISRFMVIPPCSAIFLSFFFHLIVPDFVLGFFHSFIHSLSLSTFFVSMKERFFVFQIFPFGLPPPLSHLLHPRFFSGFAFIIPSLFFVPSHTKKNTKVGSTHTEKRAYLKRWKIAIIFE